MENIQPWCISRQLWWGHQIPAWYGPDGKVFVAETEDEVLAEALAHYTETEQITPEQGHDIAADREQSARFLSEYLKRDEDVLDTWFSSALWPFSTLGWPDQTPELARYYPTSVLVTGFDIIFFWVARMMMMGLHFMGEVPFRDVYIHALVRDEKGAKMSKSKGNVIDPLEVIDQYGADALRFTLAAMAAQGRDIKLSAQRVEGYRNFATKLWNAARFAEVNGCARVAGFDPKAAKETLNRWIAHETAEGRRRSVRGDRSLSLQRGGGRGLSLRVERVLRLVRGTVEAVPHRTGRRRQGRDAGCCRLGARRDLQAAAPVHAVRDRGTVARDRGGGSRAGRAARARPMAAAEGLDDAAAEAEIGWVIDLINAVRSVRAEMNVAGGTALPLVLVAPSPETDSRATAWSDFIKRLARVSSIASAPAAPPQSVQLIVRGEVVALPLAGVIDIPAERARLEKDKAKAEADIARVDAKLGNPAIPRPCARRGGGGRAREARGGGARRAKIREALERLQGAA